MVQFPAGKLFSSTLPADMVHEGWIMVPIAGASGTPFTVNV
jgi:hypothetical protein